MYSILYIDDEEPLLDIAKLYLERSKDFIVDTRLSASEGLHALELSSYDAIVSDYLMPDMDGISFLIEVRSKFGNLPFILFTGKGREEVVIQAINNGADFYLQKGGDPKAQFAELAHKIKLAVQRHSAIIALKESESRFSKIFNSSPIMMVVTDPERDEIVDVNEAFLRDLQMEKEYITGKKPSELGLKMAPGDTERIAHALRREGHIRDLEFLVMRPTGEYRTVLLSMVPIRIRNTDLVFTQIIDITDRKRVEETARKNEIRFRSIIQSSNDYILVVTKAGTIVYSSPAIEKVLGYNEHYLTGRNPLDLIHPDDIDTVRREYYEALKADNIRAPLEYRVRKADGSFIYVESITSNLLAVPEINGLVISTREITQRKRIQEALRESEDRFRTLSDVALEGLMIHDKGTIIDCNMQFAALFGYEPEEIIGRNGFEFMLEEKSLETLLKWVRNGSKGTVDIIGIKKDGQRFYGETASTVILWKGKEQRIVQMHDITARIESEQVLKRQKDELNTSYEQLAAADEELRGQYEMLAKNERELRESEERYRNVVEDQTELIFRFSPDGTQVFVNDAYCRYFGLKREELLGHIFQLKIAPEDIDRVRQILTSLTPDHPVDTIECRMILSEGSMKWLRWSTRAIFDSRGKITEYQAVGQDITGYKMVEESLLQTNRKLHLLSSITRHDINNQLTILQGYLEIMIDSQHDPRCMEYLKKASSATRQISALIQITKEYGSIGVYSPVWRDIRKLVQIAVDQHLLGGIIVENDLPDGAELFADQLVVKVFYNLVDNAIRHGGEITTIRFSVEKRNGDYILMCEDDGIGIHSEEKELIFDHGFGKNTGLGLALSREILSITGITINETGIPGEGARFEIHIPKNVWRC